MKAIEIMIIGVAVLIVVGVVVARIIAKKKGKGGCGYCSDCASCGACSHCKQISVSKDKKA